MRGQTSTRPSRWVPLAVLGVSFGVALVLAELLLMLFWPQRRSTIAYHVDPIFGVQRAPKLKGRDDWPGVYNFRFTTNSLGLRGTQEYPFGDVPQDRILLLGDSFTFGVGVNDDETFADQLQKRLDQAAAGRYQVVNAGQPGKGTDYALLFLEERGAELKPSTMVLGFNSTDYFDNEKGEYFVIEDDGSLTRRDVLANVPDRSKKILKYRSWYSWFLDRFHLGGLLKASYRGQVVVASSPAGFGAHDDLSRTIESTDVYLGYVQQMAGRMGADFFLLYVPWQEEVEAFKASGEVSEKEESFVEMAEALQVPWVSTTPALAENPACCADFYFLEGHWNQEGHTIAARVLYEALRQRATAPVPDRPAS